MATKIEKLATVWGSIYISSTETVFKELKKMLLSFKKELSERQTIEIELDEICKKVDGKYCLEFSSVSTNSFLTNLSFLYENKDEKQIDWKLLKNSNYEIKFEFMEWSPNRFGDFIRKSSAKIKHISEEQIVVPRIENVENNDFPNTWANRLKFEINENLKELIDEELEFSELCEAPKDEAPFQVGFELMEERKNIEEYFNKSLSEIYKSEFKEKGHIEDTYKTIFNVANMTN